MTSAQSCASRITNYYRLSTLVVDSQQEKNTDLESLESRRGVNPPSTVHSWSLDTWYTPELFRPQVSAQSPSSFIVTNHDLWPAVHISHSSHLASIKQRTKEVWSCMKFNIKCRSIFLSGSHFPLRWWMEVTGYWPTDQRTEKRERRTFWTYKKTLLHLSPHIRHPEAKRSRGS